MFLSHGIQILIVRITHLYCIMLKLDTLDCSVYVLIEI